MAMSNEWGVTAGRRFKVCTGAKSQSINVCFEEPARDGKYEYRYKLWGTGFLTAYEIELQGFETVAQLREFVISKNYQDISNELVQKRQWMPLEPDLRWGCDIRAEIEVAIEKLTKRFLTDPYRHRVEHSLHCELFGLLNEIPAIRDGRIAIANGYQTGLVHKEWPETLVREFKTGRGNFDLALLTPLPGGQPVEEARFLGGHIKPYAAFELGLDYDRDHFLSDVLKLRHSQIDAGYVIHFARSHALDQEQVRECLEELNTSRNNGEDGWPRLVVAILKRDGETFVKVLG
jgi:hypothetical protein